MMVIAGLCWIVAALIILFFLFGYLAGGAGLQVFGFFFDVSPASVVLGLVYFVGFAAAACLCFIVGAGLCAHGLVPAPEPEQKTAEEFLTEGKSSRD
jgi:hypothetical protein